MLNKFTRYSRAAAAACMFGYSGALLADDADGLQQRLQQLEQQMLRAQQAHEQEIKSLRARISAMEGAAQQATPAHTATPPAATVGMGASPAGAGGNLAVGLSTLVTAGGSSAGDEEISGLQAGGHDPNRNGFTAQNIELTLSGSVDPYFDAQASIVLVIDQHGETKVELEEAFAVTRALPHGLQIKGGQYYTEFGRHNVLHPHAWAFVDQPVILSRLLGPDGLRSQGARVSWLMPTPWYSELYVGAQNAKGHPVVSFLYEEEEFVGGYELIHRDVEDFSDLLYSARWLNGFDLSDTLSVNLGLSALRGPNASGPDTSTSIHGADLYLKWQPLVTQRGFPFVAWHSELLNRRYQTPGATLKDSGGFTQALWGFKPGWVAGLRLEYAEGSGGAGGYDISADSLRDNRTRVSPNLTWYLSEFSKLRLQYNHDRAEFLADGRADSLWLQFEYSLGAHAAHQF